MPDETLDKQYCSPGDVSSIINKQNESILIHINMRSIQRNFSKLETFLQIININPDFIMISETWITPESFFQPCLNGYTFLSQPSSSKAGGVAMFIKNGIEFRIKRWSENTTTFSWELMGGNNKQCYEKGIICSLLSSPWLHILQFY